MLVYQRVVDFKLPCFPLSRGGLHCSLGPSGARINGVPRATAAGGPPATLIPGGGGDDEDIRTFKCLWLLGGSSQLGNLEAGFLQPPGKRQTISMEKNHVFFCPGMILQVLAVKKGLYFTSSTRTSRGRKFPVYKKNINL